YLIMLCLALLAGCSTLSGLKSPATDPVQAAQANIAQITQADLTNAISIAKANNDIAGVNCLTALQAHIPNSVNIPKVNGVFSAYELTRVKVRAFQNGVPQDVHIACAPVVLDAQGVLLKLGVIAAGAPGVGAAGLGILGAGKALAGSTP
ncbi:MAG: hypothetical protein KGI54_18985, partial [Pseudomonadota bacterium]|nr:hypothetical protein [Pseudomonadota bacterium]